jgi:poly(ADP-ribose) glycohydrolase ARH3
MSTIDLKSKVQGGILGSAIGDAIGETAFLYPEKDGLLAAVNRASELCYTDDTAMAIGLAESIVKEEGIDQNRLGETFRDNFLREPWRGYASGPPTIFSQVQKLGITYREAARNLFGGQGSFGNGAAMRVAPVGVLYHKAPDLYAKAALSAEVTHAHPVGVDGAAVQARAVALSIKLDPREAFPTAAFIQDLAYFSRTQEIKTKMRLVKDLISNNTLPGMAVEKIGRSVAVHESMPFAIYAFLRYPTSFESCLLCAILNGGDRDTLGAMAGAVSGAYLGVQSIPVSWMGKLENRDYIENLALQLTNAINDLQNTFRT